MPPLCLSHVEIVAVGKLNLRRPPSEKCPLFRRDISDQLEIHRGPMI